jgi:hypothetical protein
VEASASAPRRKSTASSVHRIAASAPADATTAASARRFEIEDQDLEPPQDPPQGLVAGVGADRPQLAGERIGEVAHAGAHYARGIERAAQGLTRAHPAGEHEQLLVVTLDFGVRPRDGGGDRPVAGLAGRRNDLGDDLSERRVAGREIQSPLSLDFQGRRLASGVHPLDDDIVQRVALVTALELHALGHRARQSAWLSLGQQAQKVEGADLGFEATAGRPAFRGRRIPGGCGRLSHWLCKNRPGSTRPRRGWSERPAR